MRVVITGASGYIGRSLTEALIANGTEVVGLSRTDTPGLYESLGSGRVGNLVDHFSSSDHVVHLAGRLVVDKTAGITDYYEANVEFTDQVMKAATQSGVVSVVHASSRLVYPSTLTAEAVEDCDEGPDTPYGISKSWAEDVVAYYSAMSNYSAVSLRIGQVTGGEHAGLGLINSFISQAKRYGLISVTGSGGAVRDFVHVSDVTRAIVAALSYRGGWKAINIGGSAPMTITEIAESVVRASGAGVLVQHVEVESEDTSCYALDRTRAGTLLGWGPQWTTDEIIASTYAH